MTKIVKKFFLLICLVCMADGLFALEDDAPARIIESFADPDIARLALADAYNAYKASDYQSAVMLLRRALSDPQNQSDSALYMLVMAGMYSGLYKGAYADTEYFLQAYPKSPYAPLIKYQQGRDLFFLGDYDKAVLTLGDFCHENPDSSMYASALFWIAECFYQGYNFEQARPLYERIVNEFPGDAKAVEAKYRLDAINQRLREEKLLYLLQQTGESYLSSKENYEKALRRYELENQLGVQERPDSGEGEVPVQAAPVGESENTSDYNFMDALRRLKMSAAEAQGLLSGEGGQ